MSENINEAMGIAQEPKQPAETSKTDKYSSLTSIAGLLGTFAWITGGIIVIAAFLVAAKAGNRYYGRDGGQSILLFLLYAYLGVFVTISLLAQSGIIKVLIDIEKNTRKSKQKE